MGGKSILAVVVLYKIAAEGSPAFQGVRVALDSDASIQDAIDLMVCDNSPNLHSRPLGFSGLYVHDGKNEGLAKRYNLALNRALETGAVWLMLLDQDTRLNGSYLREAMERVAALEEREEVVAIVPKLMQGPHLLSPHVPQYAKAPFRVDASLAGMLNVPLRVFNSGALLRVSRLEAIGGFPEHFWLDYLDHATFHLLQRDGGKIFVMNTVLQHELSSQTLAEEDGTSLSWRQWNTLEAASDFYKRYGTRRERNLHWLQIGRMALGAVKQWRYGHALRLFGTALGRRHPDRRARARDAVEG